MNGGCVKVFFHFNVCVRLRAMFRVVEVSTSKTGKHGHVKCRFVAIDIFTSKKLQDIVPSSNNCDTYHMISRLLNDSPLRHRMGYRNRMPAVISEFRQRGVACGLVLCLFTPGSSYNPIPTLL
ncbi:hypothetical protein YC2023_104016 [Brassica napus]